MKSYFKRQNILSHASNPTGFTAGQVANLYGFPASIGSGQGIGIIELGGGYQQSDLDTYFSGLSLLVPNVAAVGIDGATNAPTGDPSGADGEVGLDIQIAGAVAPGALIKVFFAPNTDSGFLNAIKAAIADPQINIISISWGSPEDAWVSTDLMAEFDSVFAGSNKLIFVASGDSGSSDGEVGRHVDFPGSSPHVVSCGATSLMTSGMTIVSEVVWNSNGGSSGGGVSSFFPLPSYQAKASVPGGHFRGVPDVAGSGDPNSGYMVVIDGKQEVYGGTSCVAPLYAGLFARINSILVAGGHTVLKSANAVLYALGLPAATQTGFREILSGNNGVYVASAGWNPCCGLGSPKGTNILNALRGSLPPATAATAITYNKWLNNWASWIAAHPSSSNLAWLNSMAMWIAANPAVKD